MRTPSGTPMVTGCFAKDLLTFVLMSTLAKVEGAGFPMAMAHVALVPVPELKQGDWKHAGTVPDMLCKLEFALWETGVAGWSPGLLPPKSSLSSEVGEMKFSNKVRGQESYTFHLLLLLLSKVFQIKPESFLGVQEGIFMRFVYILSSSVFQTESYLCLLPKWPYALALN